MDTDLKKLKKLVLFCRKNGVLSLKQGEIEISLSPAAMEPESVTPQTTEPDAPLKPEYAAEDMLFWSAPGFPEEANQ